MRPRLSAPKQHHQHARAAAAAAAAAVIVAREEGSNYWEGHGVAEQRANSHVNGMFALLWCSFIEVAYWC
jgi:hypothetical protein